MTHFRPALTALFVAFALQSTANADEKPRRSPPASSSSWGSWRGPLAKGVSPEGRPPVDWSEKKNVRWKTALPGKGHSSPVVAGDRIFLTTAIPHGKALPPQPDTAPGAHDNVLVTHRHRYVVIAVDRRNGKILWEKEVNEDLPHEGGHYTASLASGSPITDGEHVYAFFGSRGLFCLDLGGEIVWKKDLGKMATKHGHGEGATPVLHDGVVAVNWDHEGQSFLVVYDAQTGDEKWRKRRDEVTSWSSPIVVEHRGRSQLIVCGSDRVRAYDLANGKVIWECGGLSKNIVASPVSADGIVYTGSSYEIRSMLAIRLEGARGDITGSENVLWRRRHSTPYVPSPLLYGDSLYFLRHYQPILFRLNAKSGEETHAVRLFGLRDIYASPVGADGRVYITDRNGTTAVLQHEGEPKVLALNKLDDRFNASAAIVGNELFLRGEKHLYCLADASDPPKR